MRSFLRRYNCKRYYFSVLIIPIVGFYLFSMVKNMFVISNEEARRNHERRLQATLLEQRGYTCEVPQMDPFDKEIMQFFEVVDKIYCPGFDWVACHHSICKVKPEILETHRDVSCLYKDIIYITDKKAEFGEIYTINGSEEYQLVQSDHVHVKCTGIVRKDNKRKEWIGFVAGFRPVHIPPPRRPSPPSPRARPLNVLFVGFDSTSKNGFIRSMLETFRSLQKDFGAVVMDGYNVLGDGTPATLFPLLTGRTELENPDRRTSVSVKESVDDLPFIFKRVRSHGYRTVYFEDHPDIGTFNFRFTGFRRQPADHYLRHFFTLANAHNKKDRYCIGDTPSFLLMLKKTEEFMKLDGPKFAFTFISDITHDRSILSVADTDTAAWLRRLRDGGHLEDTLVVVHGDHGPRYVKQRSTLIGKLEERLPLLAIILPERYKRSHPEALANLRGNKRTLTTPHDLYHTYLEIMGLKEYQNSYRVPGSSFQRGMSLVEPIPKNRTCADAGVEAHWCACVKWTRVAEQHPLYRRSAEALVQYINTLTEEMRSKCAIRTLSHISYVQQQAPSKQLLTFEHSVDYDGYIPVFTAYTGEKKQTFSVKIAVGPGHGQYEATMTYSLTDDVFKLDHRAISRINAYNNEPSCISDTHPHLNMYCYCVK
ncbi:hypothetical protein JYU34_022314 [Plutella xylostella]|uniref:Uncharacterized protein n=1 Tax=Plutella xylostella TaxID=51655 RepID=A0ABQ7PS80_PLUXY|nr:hypothetical protein JYU34_022314 [Plutella xylostella]